VDDRLRPLWDFDDLDETERRLRRQLEEERNDPGRAEVLTQLARVEGLRGGFDRGDALIDQAVTLAEEDEVATARIDLERGRLRRSGGDDESARPLFESAYSGALAAGQYFMATDAAHMVALVAAHRDGFVDWTRRGIDLAETHEAAAYWTGPLLNNLGWEHYDAGELSPALDAFERALRARERDPANGDGLSLARYAVGKTLRGLGRADEAIPLLEDAVAWAASKDRPDGWFHEELAEDYAAVGHMDEAREHALLAIPLLESDDPSFADDAGRRARLGELSSPER
jgi:tetratricopeptide (TPR) repeat protein